MVTDRSIYLWITFSSELVKTLELDSDVNSAGFSFIYGSPVASGSVSSSPINEKLIVFGLDDGIAQLLDVTIGNHIDRMSSVVFSPSGGTHIASGSWDKTICIWDVERRELTVGPLTGHDDHVLTVAYPTDGTRPVSGSADKIARIWNSETDHLFSILNSHSFLGKICSILLLWVTHRLRVF